MKKNDLIEKLDLLGIHSRTHFYAEAFSRNLGLMTPAEQLRLARATIAIPGLGGVGGVHLMTMIRTGVGRFHLADFDAFEAANVNRQFGATIANLDRPKLESMTAQALAVNPYAEIECFPEGLTAENLDAFLDGVDVVLDGLDFFAFDIRRMLFNRAREKGVYVITAGPLGFSSAMLIFAPHAGMSFDDYFHVLETMTPRQRHLAFAMGLAPRPTHIRYMDLSRVDLDKKAGPSSNIACQQCSAMAGTEALRIILNRGNVKPVPYYFQFDPYRQKYRKGKLRAGNGHPVQRAKSAVVGYLLQRHQKAFKPEIPDIPRVQFEGGRIPEAVVHYILQAGIQAPSGDNAQPWKFRAPGNVIDLYLERKADNSFFNINQTASIISCGAVLENMRVAASVFGVSADIELLPNQKEPDLMARVTLRFTRCDSDGLAPMIWQRQTNRKYYGADPVAASDLDIILQSITGFDGTRLHLITDRTALKRLAGLVYRIDRIRTEHRPLHAHLNKMIRFTREEAVQKRDGLPLRNLEAGVAGELFLKITRPWFIMNMANRLGIGKLAACHSLRGILKAGGAGLLTVNGTEAAALLTGGRALERLWLTLSSLGIAMQPMTAITLFWHRWQTEGDVSFQRIHRPLLERAWEDYQEIFNEMNMGTDDPVMLFRFGYAPPTGSGTYRKSLPGFVLLPV